MKIQNYFSFWSRRTWKIAIVVSVVGALLVSLMADKQPWVIVIPIIVGSILVAISELYDRKPTNNDKQ